MSHKNAIKMVWGVIFFGGGNWWRVLALFGGKKGGFCFRTFNNTGFGLEPNKAEPNDRFEMLATKIILSIRLESVFRETGFHWYASSLLALA